ncbi:MAG: kelch repeat-containing protein [Planctomycetota bacterium]
MNAPACASLVLLSLPAFAYEAEVARSGGALGNTVTYDMQGDPGELWGLAFSTSEGPTPLVLFDPNDFRTLSVGFELIAQWQLGALDGAGQASLTFPLPAQVSLQGLPFYTQMVTIPGVGTIVDEISNRVAFVLGLPQQTANTIALMPEDLDLHTATTLASQDVLFAGGTEDGPGGVFFATDSYYIYDHQSAELEKLTATLSETRSFHTATLLADGRVLTLGGADEGFVPRITGEVFDPVTQTSTPTPNMSMARVGHSATLLNDGRVLVSGGTSNFDFSDPLGALSAVTDACEIYDPVTNSWSPAAPLPQPRALHQASLLGDGTVLVTGGIEITQILFIDVPNITNDARRYDAGADAWLSTASFSGPRGLHAQLTLPSGDALIVGGVDGDLVLQSFSPRDGCSIYNHQQNTWTQVASLSNARAFPALVQSGSELLVFGGIETFDLIQLSGTPVDEIESTDLSVLSWATLGQTLLPRYQPVATLFDNGERVLISGSGDNGSGGSVPDFTAELYIP